MSRRTAITRSEVMRRVRHKDTKPEMAVRRALYAAGIRYRLHSKELPGRPDLVIPRLRLAIFVHGCFWHRHEGCPSCRTPKSRVEFWTTKFRRNVERDAEVKAAITSAGWDVMVIWECETHETEKLEAAVAVVLQHRPRLPQSA